MDIELIRKEFDKRFYLWALKDTHREIIEDFPFLRTMNNPKIKRMIRIYKSFSLEDSLRFSTALVKWTKRDILEECGETLSQSDIDYNYV
jgi:hypothetical protein